MGLTNADIEFACTHQLPLIRKAFQEAKVPFHEDNLYFPFASNHYNRSAFTYCDNLSSQTIKTLQNVLRRNGAGITFYSGQDDIANGSNRPSGQQDDFKTLGELIDLYESRCPSL